MQNLHLKLFFYTFSFVCDICHDLLHKSMSFVEIAIVYVKEIVTEFIFGIS